MNAGVRVIAIVSRLHLPIVLALFAGAAQAGPITGSGFPVATEQPSLGLEYLVRTTATNLANFGEVTLFAGNFAPDGYSTADGQLLSVNANQFLFATIGTTYGGDGTNTFALPNLQGRTMVGSGSGAGLTSRTLGSVAGAPSETLTANQLPPFGGATGSNAGSQQMSTLQPSIALNQTVVLSGFFPMPSGSQATGPMVGQVLTYAGATVPTGQAAAGGQLLPISQNQPLFSIVGNTYGGNFPLNFATPNLSGRAAAGAGSAVGLVAQSLGANQGAQGTTLTVANLPPQHLTKPDGSTGVFGGGQAFSIQQPSLGLNYIIAIEGYFPTQGSVIPDGQPFLGEISLFAGTQAPAGWQFADGQLLSIAVNPALFAVIGSTYGGNGISNFALPNLTGRIPVGTGNGVTLGEQFGADTATLAFAQLPVGYPAAVQVSAVPEPPAAALLLVGLLGLAETRRAAIYGPDGYRRPRNRARPA